VACEGEILQSCGAVNFDFRTTFAVVVSGVAINPCGHMLLNSGGRTGQYCHVAAVRGYPRYMNETAYQRYLTENGKRVLSRTAVRLKNPRRALTKLEELLSKPWSWWVLPHNCAAFAEEVLQAGGTSAGLYTNCPTFESFK
jgi:hypothetical protein